MQHLVDVEVASKRGPVLLKFSDAPIVGNNFGTFPDPEGEPDLVIEYAADSSVVQIEMISISPETLDALSKAAKRLDLDLAPMVAQLATFAPQYMKIARA